MCMCKWSGRRKGDRRWVGLRPEKKRWKIFKING